ncbi:MAG: DUF2085 domain-containing protein [Anaerolineaceae bacterium]|nr:DUF2085 domain-containing protein [Anaerolineaceae bacterium]
MDNLPKWSGRLASILLAVANGLIILGWWIYTPPGLLGKADAAGYAVCHRIASRSFWIGDRQTPLCARCSGMYLGALLGFGYLARYGKRAGMPTLKVSLVLGFFLLAFAVDGGNSYLHFFPSAPELYQPQNWLRLATGTGVGLGIAAVLVPVFNQVVWQTFDNRPALNGWRDILPLLALAVGVNLAVLSDNPLILYPLALLSAFGIILILATVYTIVWLMITKKENRIVQWRELNLAAMAGLLVAMVQIFVLDAGRFWLTGTWGGFNL